VQRKSAEHVAKGIPIVATGVVEFAVNELVCRVFSRTAEKRLAVAPRLPRLLALLLHHRPGSRAAKLGSCRMAMNGAQSAGPSRSMAHRLFGSLVGMFCISTVLRPWSGKDIAVGVG